MSLRTWDDFMVPVLRLLADGQVRSVRELHTQVAELAGLSPDDLAQQLPSGQSAASNRIGWAASYLARVGALERPRRAHYTITERGRTMLRDHPDAIDEKMLRTYARPDDQWWVTKRAAVSGAGGADGADHVGATALETTQQVDVASDPTEQVEQGIARIHDDVAAQLLSRLVASEPAFFERAVLDLLVAMGYGGADGRATVTRQSRDEGIDGIIDQDALGVSRVYVQAKRYAPDRAIGRPDLQSFVGALSGKADGGVFLTTARFTADATRYADTVPARLILVDGTRLTALMIRYGVGVQVTDTYRVVELDEDFFA